MLCDDLLANRRPKPRAHTNGLGRKKRIKDSRLNMLKHPVPVSALIHCIVPTSYVGDGWATTTRPVR